MLSKQPLLDRKGYAKPDKGNSTPSSSTFDSRGGTGYVFSVTCAPVEGASLY